MKPASETRSVLSSNLESASFGISEKDASHVMGILRDGLYTDKILAVLREYGANAWDAHRMVGKKDLPIKVTIPTYSDPVLRIRDYGPGLSHEDVFKVYSQYGASTKRDTNDAVGAFGIGCLLAGQPIVTIEGVKKIEDIVEGDLVLTHKGRFRKVTSLMRRPYKGKAHRVWLSQAQVPLILTEEHPILVSNSNGDTSWLKPGEITVGRNPGYKGTDAWASYAVLPATVETTATELDIVETLGARYSHSGSLVRTQPFKFPHKDGSLSDRTRVTTWDTFPAKLALDEDLGWVLGLFAAEGSVTGRSSTSLDPKAMAISLNINETELADRFTSIVATKFGITPTRSLRPDKTILELYYHNMPLACVFSSLCGVGSYNKQVPQLVLNGTRAVRVGFLRGVFDGDGSSTRSRFVFGVSSPKLAWGVRTLMMCTEDKWGSVGYMSNYERWSISYNREAKQSYNKRVGEYLMRPIVEVSEFDLESEVFNFSVEEDESYISDFVLHNCKSGFSYSDSFTVTSWYPETYADDFVGPYCGFKRTYVAVLDESEKGRMSLLHEQACDITSTGIEVMISVRREDIHEFETKAHKLYQHFTPRPEININLPAEPVDRTILTHGSIVGQGYYGSEWIAVMGCVPYKVTLTQLDLSKISKCLPNLSGSLFFDIGDVQVSASREELKYSTSTKNTLVQKFNDLVDEYVIHALEELEQPSVSAWDKRLKLQVLSKLDLPLPEEYAELAQTHAKITYAPGTFVLLHNDAVTTRITVSRNTRILIDDTGKKISGYNLGSADYVARGENVESLLTAALVESGLVGVRVMKLSEIFWNAPYVKPKKVVNPKHKARMFTWNGGRSSTGSNNWTVISRVPQDTDVYVLISDFKAYPCFSSDVRDDMEIAKDCGVDFPVIYGYKSTDKKPATGMKGTEYRVWRETFVQGLLTPDRLVKIQEAFWKNPSGSYQRWGTVSEYAQVVAVLGDYHPISDLLDRQRTAKLQPAMEKLATRARISIKESDAGKAWMVIYNKYPLLRDQLENLWEDRNSNDWIEYIQLVDARDLRSLKAIDSGSTVVTV